jgi:hypothetical protein
MAVVETPETASTPTMPASALSGSPSAHTLDLDGITAFLIDLARAK